MKYIDLKEFVFGRLTAKEYLPSITSHGQGQWRCLCICGESCNVFVSNLQKGTSRSCGCLARELSSERGKIKFPGGWNKGLTTPKEVKRKISDALIGRATRGSGWHHTIEYRVKKSLLYRGDKSHLWKGGATKESKIQRSSAEFSLWREDVFARDNWTCQHCGKKDGSELHPHHIKLFSEHKKLRFELDNGITLCKQCHLNEHHHKF